MKLKIEFSCDNAAFGENDAGYRADEIARILECIAENIGRFPPRRGDSANIQDDNGNTIGLWRLS